MNTKRKIAIMGAGKWQMPLYLKAREMGIETHGFAYEDGNEVAREVAIPSRWRTKRRCWRNAVP